MYHYILDQTGSDGKKMDRLLGQVYGFLTQYQISGEVHRVTRLRTVPELASTAIRANARTIIAIGDDSTFLELLQSVAQEEEIVLGFIPLDSNSHIATILGIDGLQDACKAIAQRRIDEFDLGKTSNNSFFVQVKFGVLQKLYDPQKNYGRFRSYSLASKLAKIAPQSVKINVNNNYSIETPILGGLIINAQPKSDNHKTVGSSSDKKLDLMLLPKLPKKVLTKHRMDILSGDWYQIPGATTLHARTFTIEAPGSLEVELDGTQILRPPLNIGLRSNGVKIIIGKGRRG